MNNPWLELPSTAPYLLESDRQQVETFNRTAKPNHRIYDDLLPEPYLGNPSTASIVLLSLNPGFSYHAIFTPILVVTRRAAII